MRSFEVDGVSCGRCIAHITRAVQDLDADAVVSFNYHTPVDLPQVTYHINVIPFLPWRQRRAAVEQGAGLAQRRDDVADAVGHGADEGAGADAAALGATRVDLSDKFGVALQAGFDLPLNERGLGFSVDAKRYFVDTTATFYAGNTVALRTDHSLDPWVISAGLSYRF